MKRSIVIVLAASAAALSASCAQPLDELAPFPCADDASCPASFTCLPRSSVGDDSCGFALDGACDEPNLCDPFTDTADCALLAGLGGGGDSCEFAFDGACDEPNLCAVGTDASDCVGGGPDGCSSARDGVCDEPLLCSTGSDGSDCRAVPFCVDDDTADGARCQADDDCGAGRRCEAELCVASVFPGEGDQCNLFEAGCVDGVCAATGSDAAGYLLSCVAFPPQQLPPGSNCADNGPTCGPATACYGDEINGFFCFALCDDAHPCGFGSCTFFPNETFGRCV